MSVATTRLCALAFVGLFLLSGPVVAQDLIPGTAVATKRTQALTLWTAAGIRKRCRCSKN